MGELKRGISAAPGWSRSGEKTRGEDDVGLKLGRRRVAKSFGEAGSFGGAAVPRDGVELLGSSLILNSPMRRRVFILVWHLSHFGHASIIYYEGNIAYL